MPPQYIPLSKSAKDITGQTFGRLTALGPVSLSKYGRYEWHCRCQCGAELIVAGECLRRGSTQSCGCLQKERTGNATRTHGLRSHPLYRSWDDMIRRCTNPKRREYKNYGGRGITAYEGWLDSPQPFLDYVMSLPDCGTENYTLDRIDNSLGYLPGNLRWASKTIQQRNMRSNRLLTHNGKTQCVAAWAEELGINGRTLRSRLNAGWSVERTLNLR